MSISEVLDKIGKILPAEDSKLEIEVRYFIDERKKLDVFSKTYTVEQTEHIAKTVIKKYVDKPCKVSQSINFIDGENIKQMSFINGEQQKDLLIHYRKEKIIKPMIMLHNTLPAYRFTANFETPIGEFSVAKATFARIRLRYTIQVSENWQLDITLVKQVSDFSNPAKLKDSKSKMLFSIDVKTFVEKAPWSLADMIEFELEFTGESFSTSHLEETNAVFDFLLEPKVKDEALSINLSDDPNANKESADSNYQQIIYQVAKLIKPRDAHKFQYKDGLKQLSNQVIELDKNMFINDLLGNITDYYITDKIDGSRAVLYITNNKCHVLTKDLEVFEIAVSDSHQQTQEREERKKETYVLDCEQYIDTKNDVNIKKYYIFDVMVYQNESIVDKPFEYRLKLIEEVAKLHESFATKVFERLTDDFQKQIADFKLRKVSYQTDGIILTPTNGKYVDMQVYKYKPIEKLSIDFVIKKCPAKLLGIHPYINKPNKTLYLLFSGMRQDTFKQLNLEFVRNYEDIFPGVDTRRLPSYFPYQFQPSNFTFAYLYWGDEGLDGEVGEFVCSPCVAKKKYIAGDDLWHLHKIRVDRRVELARGNYYGNYFKVAELSWMSYNDPLIIEDLNLKEQQSYFQQHDNILQKASRNFNSYVKAQLFNQFAGTEWTLDIASGKGQDIFRYASNKFTNVCFLEIDNTALLELIKRKFDLRNTNPMNVLVHQMDLNKKHEFNISQLSDIAMPSDGVDLVICNFAFHYFLQNTASLVNVVNFISHYLKPGGRFAFTTFDAKAVIQLLNENGGNWTISDKGQVKYSIKKAYTTNYLESIGQKIEVLLPFSKDAYYAEYLVNIDYIEEEMKRLGFTLESDEPFGDHLEGFKKQNNAAYSSMDANDKKYSSLYHTYCFYKKKVVGGKKRVR